MSVVSPVPGAGGTGPGWVRGDCAWRCGRPDVPVLWVGDVASSGMHAPLHICGDCLRQLDAMVWAWARRRDGVR
ncbi:hypothetical protein ACFW9F_04815 [Streptomyces sp. NPDC059506]|uniref:hypothetical protein n=1 Tax=Streptomyces sp. NPDC059506 TaxID=3347751 RepID=UPI00267F6CF5